MLVTFLLQLLNVHLDRAIATYLHTLSSSQRAEVM